MNEQSIFPFGFLSEHLLREMKRRNLSAFHVDASGCQRVVAIGVPGAEDDRRAEEQLMTLLPSIDAAIVFTGMAFEQNTRQRSKTALLEMFKARGIPVRVIDQEVIAEPLGAAWGDMSMHSAMDYIAAALLDLLPDKQAA
jgi:hypothetical protein